MNDYKILYQLDDTITIVSIVPDVDIATIISTLPPGAQHIIVESNTLPNDNDLSDFFGAMEINFNTTPATIQFNIEKARNITKSRLRIERSQYFEKNDILIRDAMIEDNLEKLNVAIIERDRLRDITEIVNNANTLDELRNLSV